MRKQFAKTLLELAKKDKRIVTLIGDVSYSELEEFRKLFPDRFYNMGLCEQTIIGISGGLAINGLRPIVHSITPFILERAFEQIKIDIDESNLPIILMGYDDYPTYGFTHRALNVEKTIDIFKNIKGFYPKNNYETEKALLDAYLLKIPAFIWLKKDSIPFVPKGDI